MFAIRIANTGYQEMHFLVVKSETQRWGGLSTKLKLLFLEPKPLRVEGWEEVTRATV